VKIKAYSLVFFTWIFLLVSFNVQASQISTTDAVQQEEVNPFIAIVAADMKRKKAGLLDGYLPVENEPYRPTFWEKQLGVVVSSAASIAGILFFVGIYRFFRFRQWLTIHRRFKSLREKGVSKITKVLIVGCGVWLLAVSFWGIIFEWDNYFDNVEYFFLYVSVPIIGGSSVLGLRWIDR